MWPDEIIDSGHASVQLSASMFQNNSQVRALSQKTSGMHCNHLGLFSSSQHLQFSAHCHKDKNVCKEIDVLINY